ncbi:MAG: hypothetical protein IJS96_07765 [Schwartzia sp.]|nr:hypothetical protein [Schwartzia sp. (in: firmicutes)]
MKYLRMVKAVDWIIAAVAAVLLPQMDFNNMTIPGVLYLTAFIMWLGMLLIRLYLQATKARREVPAPSRAERRRKAGRV